jgi:hypothetical protein
LNCCATFRAALPREIDFGFVGNGQRIVVKMNCEEFEAIGLDSGTGRVTSAEEVAAAEHAGKCAECAALAESWDAARAELAVFAEATQSAQTPARVQMRLLQELRAQKHSPEAYRRTGMIAAWGLVAAALIVVAVSWQNWRVDHHNPQSAKNVPAVTSAVSSESDSFSIVADEDTAAFTPLPGALPLASEEGSIYQVRLQRASLGALGLPVNEDGAADWINVDLLVADDGTPQGVRLHEDAADSATLP